jgi:hypothetical protein
MVGCTILDGFKLLTRFTTGLFLALDVYRPKYAAGSSHIVGTYRDDKNVLMAGIAFWLVRSVRLSVTPRILKDTYSSSLSTPTSTRT